MRQRSRVRSESVAGHSQGFSPSHEGIRALPGLNAPPFHNALTCGLGKRWNTNVHLFAASICRSTNSAKPSPNLLKLDTRVRFGVRVLNPGITRPHEEPAIKLPDYRPAPSNDAHAVDLRPD
jgi:hypothetical protein